MLQSQTVQSINTWWANWESQCFNTVVTLEVCKPRGDPGQHGHWRGKSWWGIKRGRRKRNREQERNTQGHQLLLSTFPCNFIRMSFVHPGIFVVVVCVAIMCICLCHITWEWVRGQAWLLVLPPHLVRGSPSVVRRCALWSFQGFSRLCLASHHRSTAITKALGSFQIIWLLGFLNSGNLCHKWFIHWTISQILINSILQN